MSGSYTHLLDPQITAEPTYLAEKESRKNGLKW